MQRMPTEIANPVRSGRSPGPCTLPSEPIRASASSPDVRLLALLALLGVAIFWKLGRGGMAEREPAAGTIIHEGRIEGVAISPDGRHYASASREDTARAWDAATRHPVGPIARGPSGFAGVVFAPDGATLACFGLAGEVVLLDLRAGRDPARFAGDSPAPLRAGAFSPDGRLLATGGDDRTVRVRDVSAGGERFRLLGHEDRVRGLVFSRDGRSLLSAGSEGRVISWDLATGAIAATFDAGVGPLWSVSLSPDGGSLALGGRDGIALRDLASGRIRVTRCNRGVITKVCFVRSGKALATADEEGRLAFWEATGSGLRLRREVLVEGDRVNSLAASPDGLALLTGSIHSRLTTWDLGWLDPGHAVVSGQGLANVPGPAASSRNLVGAISLGQRRGD